MFNELLKDERAKLKYLKLTVYLFILTKKKKQEFELYLKGYFLDSLLLYLIFSQMCSLKILI